MPSNEVVLDEGGSVSVHTRIKDMCKAARNRMHLTNQDISDMITKRFGFEDFSVNTVNNFFSERSKATTIYTTGYICAVLNISIDAVFGIEHTFPIKEDTEFVKELNELKVDLRLKEQQIKALDDIMAERNERLSEAHEAIEYYRSEADKNRRKVQPWVFVLTLMLLISLLLLIIIYLFAFDIGNPDFGIFKS